MFSIISSNNDVSSIIDLTKSRVMIVELFLFSFIEITPLLFDILNYNRRFFNDQSNKTYRQYYA